MPTILIFWGLVTALQGNIYVHILLILLINILRDHKLIWWACYNASTTWNLRRPYVPLYRSLSFGILHEKRIVITVDINLIGTNYNRLTLLEDIPLFFRSILIWSLLWTASCRN